MRVDLSSEQDKSIRMSKRTGIVKLRESTFIGFLLLSSKVSGVWFSVSCFVAFARFSEINFPGVVLQHDVLP